MYRAVLRVAGTGSCFWDFASGDIGFDSIGASVGFELA
jgi:hypothetical protein